MKIGKQLTAGSKIAATLILASGIALTAPAAAQATTMHGPFSSRAQCAADAQLYASYNNVAVQDCWYDNKRWWYQSY